MPNIQYKVEAVSQCEPLNKTCKFLLAVSSLFWFNSLHLSLLFFCLLPLTLVFRCSCLYWQPFTLLNLFQIVEQNSWGLPDE